MNIQINPMFSLDQANRDNRSRTLRSDTLEITFSNANTNYVHTYTFLHVDTYMYIMYNVFLPKRQKIVYSCSTCIAYIPSSISNCY